MVSIGINGKGNNITTAKQSNLNYLQAQQHMNIIKKRWQIYVIDKASFKCLKKIAEILNVLKSKYVKPFD